MARLYAHTADDLFRRIVDLAGRGLGCRYSRTQLPNQLIVAAGENDGLLTFRRLAHRLQIAHQHLIEAVELFATEQMSCDLLGREETFQGGQDRGGTLDQPNAPPHKLFT
jgi:hypothetical protein